MLSIGHRVNPAAATVKCDLRSHSCNRFLHSLPIAHGIHAICDGVNLTLKDRECHARSHERDPGMAWVSS
jgi:hypothetical protein